MTHQNDYTFTSDLAEKGLEAVPEINHSDPCNHFEKGAYPEFIEGHHLQINMAMVDKAKENG